MCYLTRHNIILVSVLLLLVIYAVTHVRYKSTTVYRMYVTRWPRVWSCVPYVCHQVATCVVISPDSSTVACGLADCTVRLYRLDTGKVCRQSDKSLTVS